MTGLEDDLRRVLHERPAPPAALVRLDDVHAGAARRRRRTVRSALTATAAAAVIGAALAGVPPGSTSLEEWAAARGWNDSAVSASVRPLGPDARSVTVFDGGKGVIALAAAAGCTRDATCDAALGRSVDGGRTYEALPVPDGATVGAPGRAASGTVRGVRFSGGDNGWLYGETSFATRDGGRTWTRLDVGGAVVALEASRGRVFAAVRSGAELRLLSADAAGGPWRTYVQELATGPAPALVSSDRTAYLIDGRRLWVVDDVVRERTSPCSDGDEVRAAVSNASVWAACGSPAGAWSLHRSPDAASGFTDQKWPRAATVHSLASRTAGEVFVSAGGLGLVRQPAGRARVVVSPPAGGRGALSYLGFTTERLGFALPSSGGVWRTEDGGATWSSRELIDPSARSED